MEQVRYVPDWTCLGCNFVKCSVFKSSAKSSSTHFQSILISLERGMFNTRKKKRGKTKKSGKKKKETTLKNYQKADYNK